MGNWRMGKKTRKDEDGPFFVSNNVHDNFQENTVDKKETRH